MMLPNSFGGDQAAGRPHRVGERWPGADGAAPIWPAGACRFCSLIAPMTSAGVRPSVARSSGPQPHAHAVLRAAEQIDLRHARDAQQRVAHVEHRVVVQEQRVEAALGRVDRRDQQDARVDLLDREPLLQHLLRQPRLGLRHAVLREHVRVVEAAAHLEGDVEQHAAVARVQRLHVEQVVDAVDFLLDRRRHRLLDDLGVGAGVVARDAHDRRRERRILLDRQAPQRDGAGDHHQDGDHHGDDRPPDEEVGHDSTPSGVPDVVSDAAGRVRRFSRHDGGIDGHARPHLLQPFDDHLVVGLQAALDDPERADADAGLDLSVSRPSCPA